MTLTEDSFDDLYHFEIQTPRQSSLVPAFRKSGVNNVIVAASYAPTRTSRDHEMVYPLVQASQSLKGNLSLFFARLTVTWELVTLLTARFLRSS
jgi:hypothetical protein